MDPRRRAAVMAALGALSSVLAALDEYSDNKPRPIGRNKRLNDRDRGPQWVEDCMGEPIQLFEETKLRPEVLNKLIRFLRDRALVSDGGRVAMEEKVLTFLYICSNGASWRNCRRKVGRSIETISRNFHEVLNALLHLYKDIVKAPSGEIPEQIRDNKRRWPYFKDCVGALDGTYIPVYVHAEDHRRYRNRYGDLTQNVLAAVDFDMNFVYVLAGWEGSAHDGKVLRDAQSRGFAPLLGKYWLADAGYSNSPEILTPYRGVWYYLREIREIGRDAQTTKELYNYRHNSLRNVVERTFSLYKRRWRIFNRPHEFDVETQTKLVYALTGVHNLINSVYSAEDDLDDLEAPERKDLEEVQRDAENLNNLAISEVSMDDRRQKLAEDMWGDYQRARRVLRV